MKYFALLLFITFFFSACSGSKNAQSNSGEIQETRDYTTDPTIPAKVKKSTDRTLSPTNAPLIHVVQKGDSLWIIAQKFGVSVQDLIEANKIEDANLIKVNQELVIPNKK